jgi:hypothetical protein
LTCTPVDGQLVSDTKQVPVFELQARRQQNPDEQSAGKFSNPFEEPDANEELAAVDVVLSPANIMFLLDMRACGTGVQDFTGRPGGELPAVPQVSQKNSVKVSPFIDYSITKIHQTSHHVMARIIPHMVPETPTSNMQAFLHDFPTTV